MIGSSTVTMLLVLLVMQVVNFMIFIHLYSHCRLLVFYFVSYKNGMSFIYRLACKCLKGLR